jgi:predicted nucleic acid-binding protein
LAGKADFIVSGDKDLLTLNGLMDLKIFSPKQFLNEIS